MVSVLQFCFFIDAKAEETPVVTLHDPSSTAPATPEAVTPPPPPPDSLGLAQIQVAYFQKHKTVSFAEKVKPTFDQTKTCKSCELVNKTPYMASGEVDRVQLASVIQSLGSEFQIILMDWNEQSSNDNKPIAAALLKKAQSAVILFTAGSPENGGPTISLNKTLAGQIPEAVIVGEMTDRERLLPHLFYGPEMLAAIKPPKDFANQGLAPILFASRWVSHWSKNKPEDWVSALKMKKNKVRKLWLSLEDFFPRGSH